jgi:hypothetical protein
VRQPSRQLSSKTVGVTKRIVCLANSRKLNGRCVAGKEYVRGTPGQWIRPISSREHEEVSEYERQYEDGSDPHVLDVLDVPLLDPRPKNYQPENWLLDPDVYWKRHSRIGWDELAHLEDPPGSLWLNGTHTYNGLNDTIQVSAADEFDSSLKLIHVAAMEVAVYKPGEAFGNSKRRVQGRFHHDGTEYRLWITDPVYERAYLARDDGEYEIGESYLTISLGEPHNGRYYKLIAAVIERDGGPRG